MGMRERDNEIIRKTGYIEVGSIPNIYREGITESLMMKIREKIV